MNPTATRILGKSGVPVTQLGFGGAGLGELFVRVDEATAAATLKAAWDAGIRYYDTAPFYGRGLSEIPHGSVSGQPAAFGVHPLHKGGTMVLSPSQAGIL